MTRPESDLDPSKTKLPSKLLHDLRSPLNQVIGYAEILSEDAANEQRSDLVTDLEKIRDAGQRMLAVIENNFTAADSEPTVPAEWVDEDPPQGPRLVASEPSSAPGLLLVVDDDSANRDVLSRRLSRQGHDVRTASNGREALQMAAAQPFDLVLLDIMMPDMDGYEVLGHIKSDPLLQQIPVIMISSLNEVQSVVRCIDAGAEDYLTKPFDPTLLRARVGACLEKKRGHDRESRLYEQLQMNYKLLQEVEKLRDDMRNMIVHDLRTPLTSVIAGVSMLERHGDLNESQREMITIASQGGKTLLGMINDLLDVEKMESGGTHLEYHDLAPAELVSAAMSQVASLAEDNLTRLETDVAADLPRFPGDESKLSRTLVNLIANAIRFTPGGTVAVKASASDEAMLFAVTDTGAGIPHEAFARIFDKFGQVDSHSKVGTGLGLAFCRLAVEAHGGEISVDSEPGKGSTFTFTIPRQR